MLTMNRVGLPVKFSVTEQACSVSTSTEPLVSVSISGITKEVLVDSGSVSNLIGEGIFQELHACQGFKAELQHCRKKLYAYEGQELEVVGQFQAEISVAKAKQRQFWLLSRRDAVC